MANGQKQKYYYIKPNQGDEHEFQTWKKEPEEKKESCVYFVSLMLERLKKKIIWLFFSTKKCVLCLHKNHLKSKHERHYINSLTLCGQVLFVYIGICLCVEASVSTRDMWFCFIAFVYSTHYQSYVVFHLYIFFVHFSRIEKHIECDTSTQKKQQQKKK